MKWDLLGQLSISWCVAILFVFGSFFTQIFFQCQNLAKNIFVSKLFFLCKNELVVVNIILGSFLHLFRIKQTCIIRFRNPGFCIKFVFKTIYNTTLQTLLQPIEQIYDVSMPALFSSWNVLGPLPTRFTRRAGSTTHSVH